MANNKLPTCKIEEARAAKVRAKELLAHHSSVVGIGITKIDDGYGLKINLANPDDSIPELIDGVPVRREVTGIPEAQ